MHIEKCKFLSVKFTIALPPFGAFFTYILIDARI